MIDPALGYDPNDQFYYSTGLVRELIPLAVAGPELPAPGITDRPTTQGDPAEGGNMLAMMLDVRSAIEKLPGLARLTIANAILSGVDVPKHVINQIIDLLGGERPQ